MKLRRIALTAATTAAVTAGAVAVPANAYEVKYDSAADKCTITYTQTDQTRINKAYKEFYISLADATFDRLAEKTEPSGTQFKPYSAEDRRADIELVREYARTAAKPAEQAPGDLADNFTAGALRNAQRRLATYESNSYGLYVGLMTASKSDKVDKLEYTLTPQEAEDKAAAFGLDLKNILPGIAVTAIFKGGLDEFTETAKDTLAQKGLRFAAPIYLYNKSLNSCVEKESDSSSVPEGSAMSIKGLVGAVIGGLVGLLLLAVGAGFALRPVVDQMMAR